MEEDVDWNGGKPSWYDERRVEDLVKFINAPSKPPTMHEQKKHSRMIERRWRRWATRLLRSYVRTIRRRWRRCLTRLLIDEYREYVRAIPWSRCARRLLLDGRHYQLCTMQSIRTKWRTLTAGYLFAARLRMAASPCAFWCPCPLLGLEVQTMFPRLPTHLPMTFPIVF